MAKKIKSEMTREEMIEMTTENIPDLHNGAYRKVYQKAVTGNSLRAAVNAKCLDCMCWQSKEIKLCPSKDCPLWSHRPYQSNSQDEE